MILRLAMLLPFALVASLAVGAQGPPPLPPPLPPVRPPELDRPPPLPVPPPLPNGTRRSAPGPAPAAPEDAAACLARLAASGVKAEAAAPPPAPLADCGIAMPVRVSSVSLTSGTSLELPGRPILDCGFASVFADYAQKVVAPLSQSLLGSTVASLDTGPGYECRGRNGVAGAKTSAHGSGIAIDLVAIRLTDRRRIAVASPAEGSERDFLGAMRRAACGWFTTVLGPGSDAAHATHLHLDILRHGSSENYRICE
jgi:hypothetical protein